MEQKANSEPVNIKGNIFAFYEKKFSALAPPGYYQDMVEYEQTCPWEWIEEAFAIALKATKLSKRSWPYIKGILDRWQANGKSTNNGGELQLGPKYPEEPQLGPRYRRL